MNDLHNNMMRQAISVITHIISRFNTYVAITNITESAQTQSVFLQVTIKLVIGAFSKKDGCFTCSVILWTPESEDLWSLYMAS